MQTASSSSLKLLFYFVFFSPEFYFILFWSKLRRDLYKISKKKFQMKIKKQKIFFLKKVFEFLLTWKFNNKNK